MNPLIFSAQTARDVMSSVNAPYIYFALQKIEDASTLGHSKCTIFLGQLSRKHRKQIVEKLNLKGFRAKLSIFGHIKVRW